MGYTYTYYTVNGKSGALVFSNKGLLHLLLPSSQTKINRWIKSNYPHAEYRKGKATELIREILRYFQGRKVIFNAAFDLSKCSPFQRQVYGELIKIPFGSTCSYKELSETVGLKDGARAVGSALKYNPIPIIIPCHRIIRKDGSLGGFSSGLQWKRRLLAIEGVIKTPGSQEFGDSR